VCCHLQFKIRINVVVGGGGGWNLSCCQCVELSTMTQLSHVTASGRGWQILQPPPFGAFSHLKIDFYCCLLISRPLVDNHLSMLLRNANINVNCIFVSFVSSRQWHRDCCRSIPGRNISLQHSVQTAQTNSEVHLVLYPSRTLVFYKWTGHKADRSPPSGSKITKAWNYTSPTPYVFRARCLIKHMNNFKCTWFWELHCQLWFW
jgi:hypothetical protein